MSCEEFLKIYKEALDGKVPDQIISDNVNYYRSYINGEVRKGKSQQEVINSLGDPRLLAKTLEESTKFANGSGEGSYYEYGGESKKYEDSENDNGIHIKRLKMPSWLLSIIVAIVVILMLIIVFKVAFFLAPYIIAFLIAAFIFREIRNWINRY
jgi:uncharacterized membrane protein